MKILIVAFAYPEYVRYIYKKYPDLAGKTYSEQKKVFLHDAFIWEEFWGDALAKYGYEVCEYLINAEPMQRAWAAEHGMPDAKTIDPIKIIIKQIEDYSPDIFWYNHHDEGIMARIRAEIPKFKLVLSSVGSALHKSDLWKYIDVVLSCAPETVNKLTALGVNSRHLNHAFDRRILERTLDRGKTMDISFSGKIIRNVEFHLVREQILERLAAETNLTIYSPSAEMGLKDYLKYLAKRFLYASSKILGKTKPTRALMDKIPVFRKVTKWQGKPMTPINKALKPLLKPPVFGLDMYQTVQDSHIALNIHADSSPEYASNMRLYEISGAGACLLTDWKPNIGELFVPDKETVTYKSPEECVEKAKWLLSHPAEMEAIAKAGQKRTLKDHSYQARAPILDKIIREGLKSKR